MLLLAGGNICHNPLGLTLNKEEYIVRYLDRLLLTTYPFSAVTKEIKGFSRSAFNVYLGRDANDATALTMARGGIMGGTRPFLEVAATVFDIVARSTLTEGHLGTEENILRWVNVPAQLTHVSHVIHSLS